MLLSRLGSQLSCEWSEPRMEVKSIRSDSMLVFQRFLCDVMYSHSRSMDACPWDWERTAVSRELFDIRFSYKHCNFSHVCLHVKMASKTVTRSIQPCFFHGGSERLACFELTDAVSFLKKLEVHSVFYGQGKYVFKKGICLLMKGSCPISIHFDISEEEKPQNVHLKLFFCLFFCLFNLRERIQDPVSVIRELRFRING